MDRIAFTHSSTILGGSEKSFLDLVNNVSKEQAEKFVFILPNKGALYSELLELGYEKQTYIIKWPVLFILTTRKKPLVSYLSVLISLPFILNSIFQTLKILNRHKIDIIYSNGIKSHILSLVYKKILKCRVVWHMQDYFPKLAIVKYFSKFINCWPDVFIANSFSVLNDFKMSDYNWPLVDFKVVHNAVSLTDFNPKKNLHENQIVISMVGMVTPWKGQDVFIEAIHQLLKTYPNLNIECRIVGDEVYNTLGESGFMNQLKETVNQYGLGHVIKFYGLVHDVASIYADTDIVTHCSKLPEPFGRVIIEAMSCRCAVIGTNAGGVKEIIEHNKNGILVNPNAPLELMKALHRLIGDKQLRLQLAEQGRLTVENKFSAKKYAEDIIKIIEKAA